MDLEFEFKITHGADDAASSSGVRITKEKYGPVFISKETESTFILIAHLKGYRTKHVDIDINEEGTRIGISVEKPVQEMVMSSGSSGWSMHKKQVVRKGFRKVFQIPDGVVLNRIKAKFNEQDSSLRIIMPKVAKGVAGVGVEELKEEGAIIGRPQMTQAASEEVPEKDCRKMKKENFRAMGKVVSAEEYAKETEVDDQELQAKDHLIDIQGNATETEIENGEETDGVKHHKIPEATPHQIAKLSQETEVTKHGMEIPASTLPHSNEMSKERPEKNEVDKCESSEKPAASGKSEMLRTSLIVGGSALFVTLVLLAINRFRNKKQ